MEPIRLRIARADMSRPLDAAPLAITDHAADRFRERIRDTPDAKAELAYCLRAAASKYLRRAGRMRNTAVIPTGCCVLIASQGRIVTVVKELRTSR